MADSSYIKVTYSQGKRYEALTALQPIEQLTSNQCPVSTSLGRRVDLICSCTSGLFSAISLLLQNLCSIFWINRMAFRQKKKSLSCMDHLIFLLSLMQRKISRCSGAELHCIGWFLNLDSQVYCSHSGVCLLYQHLMTQEFEESRSSSVCGNLLQLVRLLFMMLHSLKQPRT